jgi:hypothetical protein
MQRHVASSGARQAERLFRRRRPASPTPRQGASIQNNLGLLLGPASPRVVGWWCGKTGGEREARARPGTAGVHHRAERRGGRWPLRADEMIE